MYDHLGVLIIQHAVLKLQTFPYIRDFFGFFWIVE